MTFTHMITFFLMTVSPILVYAHELTPRAKNAVYNSEEVSLRFHAQWTVDEETRKKLHEIYGATRIRFDHKGNPILHGLPPVEAKRWERLYKLCMSDGCYYCDAAEGSCELGTCGANNEHCRPHIGQDGRPLCGDECADYAFNSILICSDRP